MENIINHLEKLETLTGSYAKQAIIENILLDYPEGQAFLRLAYKHNPLGIKGASIETALNNATLKEDGQFSLKVYNLASILNKLKILSGTRALDYLTLVFENVNPLERKWLIRVVLRDLKIGVGIKTINEIFKENGLRLIPKFAMQLCGKVDVYDQELMKKRINYPVVAECKYDGIRIEAETLFKDGEEEVTLTSRRGTDRTNDFPNVVEFLKQKFYGQNVILDGEMIGKTFQDTMKKKGQKRYVVFDVLNDEDLFYISRWDNLVALGFNPIDSSDAVVLAEHRIANSLEEVQEFYKELNEREEEGIILKLLHETYNRSSRNNMYKCKKVYTADLLCLGGNFGTGRRENLISSLNLIDKSGHFSCSAGSGINDAMSEYLTNNIDLVTGKIIEIAYNELTSTGSIRFPRFIRIRDDKDEADDLSEAKVRQA